MIKSAYIMPHPPVLISKIGKGTEKTCRSTIYALNKVAKEIGEIKPKTIVIITPHGPVFSDGIAIGYEDVLSGNLHSFGDNSISITKVNNKKLVDRIVYETGKIDITCLKIDKETAHNYNITTDLDHGVIVPLTFIEEEYSDYELVHITYGLFSSDKLYELGNLIKNCINELNIDAVLIASGDLSHKLSNQGPYEYDKSGPLFDELLIKGLENKRLLETLFIDEDIINNAGECGKRSIDILLGSLNECDYNSRKLSYEGPFGVGYLVMSFTSIQFNMGKNEIEKIINYKKELHSIKLEKESTFVKLARRAIENYLGLNDKNVIDNSIPVEVLKQKAGVFVSLKQNGALRGCIGTIGPTKDNLALEIVDNAIKAAFEDPRFPEVEKDEIENLTITVDILMKPEVITDLGLLDTKKYGVIISTEYKRGLLLPNLESINTIDEQIKIAKNKGSITSDEEVTIERFEVVRYY